MSAEELAKMSLADLAEFCFEFGHVIFQFFGLGQSAISSLPFHGSLA